MSLHRDLIGVPGSRERLNTPALVLDKPAFERNVAAWEQDHATLTGKKSKKAPPPKKKAAKPAKKKPAMTKKKKPKR